MAWGGSETPKTPIGPLNTPQKDLNGVRGGSETPKTPMGTPKYPHCFP